MKLREVYAAAFALMAVVVMVLIPPVLLGIIYEAVVGAESLWILTAWLLYPAYIWAILNFLNAPDIDVYGVFGVILLIPALLGFFLGMSLFSPVL